MDTTEVPADIVQIAEYFALNAKASGGSLKWNEKDKLKASLMNEPARWSRLRVSPEAFDAQCREAGLLVDDAAMVGDLLRKVQSGRRLIPGPAYRNFKFENDYDPVV